MKALRAFLEESPSDRFSGSPERQPLLVRRLRKTYGATTALADLDLAVQAGEVVGLLGRNGAGKSTTVRQIVGLERPSAGDVRIFNRTPQAAARRNLIGYCSQELAFYPPRSVRENLVLFAQIAGLRRSEAERVSDATATRLEIAGELSTRSNDLSGGYKRRLHLGIALVGGAPLLVLDEPTAGVDIESRELIIDLVRNLAEQGRAVLYTSHDLTEVERICDRVAILSRGVVRAEGTIEELSGSVGQLLRIEFEVRAERDLARSSLKGGPRIRGATGLDIQLGRTQSAAETMAMVQQSGWKIRKWEVVAPGLESIFLQITRGEDETIPS